MCANRIRVCSPVGGTLRLNIRREFRLAEGDAFSAEAIRRSRQRLQDLNYFNGVNMATSQGSAPDKAIVTATIEEKATGELTLGGGYSTDAGALLARARTLIHQKENQA